MLKVFCSYSREDQRLQKTLEKHLKGLQREGLIDIWTDGALLPGDSYEEKILEQLNTAHIILLLISANFIASDYCYSQEMKYAMQRHHNGTARVIPIILKPVDWSMAPFAQLQALPRDGKPITTWNDRNEAYLDIVQRLRALLKDITLKDEQKQKPTHVIAVMGSKGGVGKGTFVTCAAQLIADSGHDVAVIDFDLAARGATLAAETDHGTESLPVKNVFDHLAPLSVGYEQHKGFKNEKLWDITPYYLRERKRGKIFLLPARTSSTHEDVFRVVANIPDTPEEPREEKLVALTQQMLARIQVQHPSVRCVFIDCGAEPTHPLYSAAFACAHHRYIITLPDPKFFKTVTQIQNSYRQHYTEEQQQEIFVVINQYTSDEDKIRCQSLRPRGYIPFNPLLQRLSFSTGEIDYDLGFGNVFTAVYECLPQALNTEEEHLLPDEIELRIKPWWNRFIEGKIAERTLRSSTFRRETILYRSLVVLPGLAIPALLAFVVIRLILLPGAPLSWDLLFILFLGLIVVLAFSIRSLILHEKRRRLLRKITRIQADDYHFLLELLTQDTKSNREILRWLHSLSSKEQKQLALANLQLY